LNQSIIARRAAPAPIRLLDRLVGRERLDRLSDQELVERAVRSDSHAFGELYRRYVDDVFLYIRLRVVDPRLSEDLTQDVFLGAYRGLAGFRWQGVLRPWLLRCAHNRVANHWRTLSRRPAEADWDDADEEAEGLPEPLIDDADLSEVLAIRMDAHAIARAMACLTDLQREAITLRFWMELSVAETAEVMGRSEAAVKNLQYAALLRMRRDLGNREEQR